MQNDCQLCAGDAGMKILEPPRLAPGEPGQLIRRTNCPNSISNQPAPSDLVRWPSIGDNRIIAAQSPLEPSSLTGPRHQLV